MNTFIILIKNSYKFLILVSLLAILFHISACQENKNPKSAKEVHNHPKHEYRVVGYVTGWRGLDFSTIHAEKLTHINYAFANCVDGEIRFGPEDNTNYDAESNEQDLLNLRKLKTKNPNLKILISVGGWTWSKYFSDAALKEESREKFAASTLTFLKKYQLDGVDIDWEYPGQIGDGNVFRPDDKENFTKLLKKVREYLDIASENDESADPDKYLLTIATGANQSYIDHTELGEAQQYLDFINIMTYDFHTGSSQLTGHQANLYLSAMPGTTNRSIDKSVKAHIDAGVPARKLVVGVPFYGRIWYGVSPENNGLYQESDSGGGSVSFSKIKIDFNEKNGFVKHMDETASAVYLFNNDSQTFITFDDVNTLVLKLEYVKENDLGGVMFWEYSHDHNSELINTLHKELSK